MRAAPAFLEVWRLLLENEADVSADGNSRKPPVEDDSGINRQTILLYNTDLNARKTGWFDEKDWLNPLQPTMMCLSTVIPKSKPNGTPTKLSSRREFYDDPIV